MNKKVLIIIIVVLVVALAGGAVWFFVLRDTEPKYTQYSPGDYFVTNLLDSSRFFKTTVVLVVEEDKKFLEKLTKENAQIRDSIIFILRSLSEEDVSGPGSEQTLRQLIIDELNECLMDPEEYANPNARDKIVDVYFNDFVLQ